MAFDTESTFLYPPDVVEEDVIYSCALDIFLLALRGYSLRFLAYFLSDLKAMKVYFNIIEL